MKAEWVCKATTAPEGLEIPPMPGDGVFHVEQGPRPGFGSGGYAVVKPTIWQRLGFGHASAPYPGAEPDMRPQESWDWPEGCITVNVVGVLDWRDWLRVLVSGRVSVQVKVRSDVTVSRAISTSGIAVLPLGAT